jgi:hypothetical protein
MGGVFSCPAQTLPVPGMAPGFAIHAPRGCSDAATADLGDAHCPDGERELPGLEDEVHGGPDADVGTSIASGLEDGLSNA